MSSSILEIMNALTEAKAQIKTIVAKAKEAAPAGLKMPHGQHQQFVASSKVAVATLNGAKANGYVEASARFGKTGDLIVTYRRPMSLEQRVAKHQASAEARKAKIAARKAAKAGATQASAAAGANTDPLAALASEAKAA